MTILQVANLGERVLREVAAPVERRALKTPAFQAFLDDLIESMLFHDGVGLAAPQVFRSLRVVAVYVPPESDEAGMGMEPTVLINPELVPVGDTMVEDWEGCLSLKDLRGLVPRHQDLVLRAWDRQGGAIERTLKGYPARVVQHEVDHLDGIVFVDRMKDLSSLCFLRELERNLAATRDEP